MYHFIQNHGFRNFAIAFTSVSHTVFEIWMLILLSHSVSCLIAYRIATFIYMDTMICFTDLKVINPPKMTKGDPLYYNFVNYCVNIFWCLHKYIIMILSIRMQLRSIIILKKFLKTLHFSSSNKVIFTCKTMISYSFEYNLIFCTVVCEIGTMTSARTSTYI